jgi:hypothetical protein
LFDFAGWTAQATWSKLAQNASAVQQYLPEDEQQKLVLDYFDALQASQALNAAITRIYADATVTDPDAATTTLRQTLAVVRAALEAKQPLVEAILQEQTGANFGCQPAHLVEAACAAGRLSVHSLATNVDYIAA